MFDFWHGDTKWWLRQQRLQVLYAVWHHSYFVHESGGEVLWWVCLSVGVSVLENLWKTVLCGGEDISRTTCAIFIDFCACCLWLWLGPPLAGWRNPKGKGQFLDFSSPLTMHCNTFAAKGIIQYRPRRGWWECTVPAKCNLQLLWFV